MKNLKKILFLIIAVIMAASVLVGCANLNDLSGAGNKDGISNKTGEESNNKAHDSVVSKYAAMPASEMGSDITLKTDFRDDDYYYYMFYLGKMENVPLQKPSEYNYYRYNGNAYSKSFSTTKSTSTTIEEQVTKATSTTEGQFHEGSFDFKVEIASGVVLNLWAKAKTTVGFGYKGGWNKSTTDSLTESYKKAETNSVEETDATIFSFDSSSKLGYYRYIQFGTIDVYTVVIYDYKTNTYYLDTVSEIIAQGYDLDYSASSIFDDCEIPALPFDMDILNTLGYKPETYYGNGELPDDYKPPATSNAEILETTFSAYLWCKNSGWNSNLGKVTFTVTGIKVRYNGGYYIYGNAWYKGTLGNQWFANANELFLKSSDRSILMGGTLHWQGPIGNNEESGVAGWYRKSTEFNTKSISYMVEDPGKDVAADKEIKISITDVCVSMGISGNDETIPEIATTTFSANLASENLYWKDKRDMGRITFDVIGIKVKYANKYYIMGNAFYSGNSAKSDHGDINLMYLENSTRNILFGGILHWQGEVGNHNKSGIAGFDKNYNYNSTSIRYVAEDPGKDFAGNKTNQLSITGICVQVGAVDGTANLVPEIVTTTFTSSLYCETTYSGSATFSVMGIKVNNDGEDYVYGSAFSFGKPGGNYFGDVDTFSFKTIKNILLGGTLLYSADFNNNKSGIVGFNAGESLNEEGALISSNNIKYLQEDPGKDFAANETCYLSIAGICVAYK